MRLGYWITIYSRKISCKTLVPRTIELFCNPRKFFYFKCIFVSYFNDIDGLSIVDLSRIKLFCQIMSHYNKSDSKQTQEVASAYFIPIAIHFSIYKIHFIEQIGLTQHYAMKKSFFHLWYWTVRQIKYTSIRFMPLSLSWNLATPLMVCFLFICSNSYF